jgi:hypothetical protein
MVRWPRCPERSAGAGFQCELRKGHRGPHHVGDPADSPLVRQVLYTNDVSALLSAVIGGLMFRARPERIKAALEGILEHWDEHVATARSIAMMTEQHKG